MAKKTAVPTCQIARRAYRINGEDTFLYSGEMHYFRIPRRYWEKHLQALLDAGCNGVSTYVPWSWHEYKEGTTDLTGKTHPERDLVGFLDLVRATGLLATVKPGPYIMAETTDQGIPRWLTDGYPETKARDIDGESWGPDYITYAHPLFRKKAARWLRLFARRIVLPRQALDQGAIIQMQLCNEIGMFQWLGSRGDYAPANVAQWHKYLEERFSTPKQLGLLIDRDVSAFTDVYPPHAFCDSRPDFVLYQLWHDYHRRLYADYVGFVADTLRETGVTVPFFTNVGGWVYGRAHEFPLNGTFHRLTAKEQPDVFYGVDHIPEYVSAVNSHDGVIATQVCDELQRGKMPLYSAELQCGSREHGVQPYPSELGLFYRQCLIHGLTGMNFYMFAQGKNPKGRGMDGPMFYWYNAVDYKGKRLDVFPTIQQLGEWLKQNGSLLLDTKKPADMAVAYYPPMYENEFLFPKLQRKEKTDCRKLGITDPVQFRDSALFDGVIRILVKQSIPYDFADITVRTEKNLRGYRSLVMLSNEIMDAATQKKLLRFVENGGRLVLFPSLPEYDLDFKPCRILADGLGIKLSGQADSRRIYMDRMKDIPVPGAPHRIKPAGCKVLAKTADGDVAGVEKKAGKGVVRYFGFHLQYTIEEHPHLWSAMMELEAVEKNAWADNDLLQLEARFSRNEGVLFVGNVHRAPAQSCISVRHPSGGDPIALGKLKLDALTGLLLPIHARLSNAITLVYAHGELLNKKATAEGAVCTLRGPANSVGRIALKCKHLSQLLLDDTAVPIHEANGLFCAEYLQTGRAQTLRVIL